MNRELWPVGSRKVSLPPRTPCHLEGELERAYAEPRGLSRDRLVRHCQMLQGGYEDCAQRGGGRGELETAAGDEPRLASDVVPPPDHGAPDHLGGPGQRSQWGWQVELAVDIEAQEVEVFDRHAREAEIAELDLAPP
jgi:hypothetical protein